MKAAVVGIGGDEGCRGGVGAVGEEALIEKEGGGFFARGGRYWRAGGSAKEMCGLRGRTWMRESGGGSIRG